MEGKRPRCGIFILISIYIIIGFLYSIAIVPWDAPDELNHFQYIELIAKEKSLPNIIKNPNLATHHPPLYYTLIAGLMIPLSKIDIMVNSNPDLPEQIYLPLTHRIEIPLKKRAPGGASSLLVHLLRTFSIIMGAITVYFTYRISLLIFPTQKILAITSSGFVAFIPNFDYAMGVISNENLVIMLSTIALYILIKSMTACNGEKIKSSVFLGIIFGLALLSKITAFFLLPTIVVAELLKIRKNHFDLRKLFYSIFLIFSSAILISGWWFLRNLWLYGDIMGWKVHFSLIRRPPDYPLTYQWFEDFLIYTFKSFWSWIQGPRFILPLPQLIMLFYEFITGISIFGLFLLLIFSKRREKVSQFEKRILIVLFVSVISIFAIALAYNMNTFVPYGRFLFPAISAISILIVFGLLEIAGEKNISMIAISLTGLMLILALISYFMVLLPIYYPRASKFREKNVIFYEDAGHPKLEPHKIKGTDDSRWSRNPSKTLAIDGNNVLFSFDGLNPERFYKLILTYYQTRRSHLIPIRSQTLESKEILIHDELMMPSSPTRYSFDIPREAHADGKLELNFKKVKADVASVAEIWIIDKGPIIDISSFSLKKVSYSKEEPVNLSFKIKNKDLLNTQKVLINLTLHKKEKDIKSDISIASGNIIPMELNPGEKKYVDVAEKFNVNPGKYFLSINWFYPEKTDTPYAIYQAEDMPRITGKVESCPDAENGFAVKGSITDKKKGFIMYGPYKSFNSGCYRANFKLSVDDNTMKNKIATLEITTQNGKKILTGRVIIATKFEKKNTFQDFLVEFSTKKPYILEFRVDYHGFADLWVDRVIVSSLGRLLGWKLYPEAINIIY